MDEFKPIHLCKYCIMAIQSRGEELFVGREVLLDPDDPKTYTCEFCDEEVDTVYECI